MRLPQLLIPLAALALSLAGCGGGGEPTDPTPTGSTPDGSTPAVPTIETTTFSPSLGIDLGAPGWTKTSTGLYYRTLAAPAGTAAAVANGQRVAVRYTGWLANGTQFESSTVAFVLGSGEVIPGWDQGIVGMRVGERRQLLIPPALGFGARANGPIPANSVLVFNVEVISAT